MWLFLGTDLYFSIIKKTCNIINFNPIGKRGWKIDGCTRWRDEKKPEKTAGSSMEDQKLVKPKAGSAVVESSADKEGNNKTSETMSSGSFPKKASTSKLKAKNNLTKAKAKNAAMKMREAESKQADQPEEDGAYASSDKGQPPIPPIIPKKLIKKEKAVTKAGGQNTTKTKNKDSIQEGDSEDAKEEAKIEKKPLGKASKASAKKASARQENTDDGGQIVSGGKKKVKVPPEPERFLASNEDKKSDSKPKKGSVGSAGKQKSAAAKERGKNQKTKEEKEKNEDEKKHPDDEDKIIKVSEPKLKTKLGKKGSAASNKKGEKAKKDKPALEEEAKTNEKGTA